MYPAEEVTTDNESHVLVYGIDHSIKSGLSLHEVLDEAKKQNAVTIAPHPFSLLDALREDSVYCDLFEVFNSSNVDVYSNLKAKKIRKGEIFATNIKHYLTNYIFKIQLIVKKVCLSKKQNTIS